MKWKYEKKKIINVRNFLKYIICCKNQNLQEVVHIYLNKFENAVTHLFLVILDNTWFPWFILISKIRSHQENNS